MRHSCPKPPTGPTAVGQPPVQQNCSPTLQLAAIVNNWKMHQSLLGHTAEGPANGARKVVNKEKKTNPPSDYPTLPRDPSQILICHRQTDEKRSLKRHHAANPKSSAVKPIRACASFCL